MPSTISQICDADERNKMIERFGDGVIKLFTIKDFLKSKKVKDRTWRRTVI